MYRPVFLSLIFIALLGCTIANEPLVGKPVYFKNINDDAFWENIIVYGKLKKETIRQPTAVYGSSFGHAYCMAEEISFKVDSYLQGSGPELIQFTQNVIDSCKPLAADIGFGEAILFLSKNEFRGVWSTDSIKIFRIDDEDRIFQPSDIIKFSSFKNFDALLSTYENPFEWIEEKNRESHEILEALKKREILDFEIVKINWPKMPEPWVHGDQAYGEFYTVKMYKYIKIDTLIENEF